MDVEWELSLDGITVRQHRDPGDLTDLAVSIAQAGIVRPIAVLPDGTLLSGYRRVQAAREIGLDHVPAVAITELSQAAGILAGDLAEHEGQLPMPWKARLALGRQLEALPRNAGIGDSRAWIAKCLGIGTHSWVRLRTVGEAIDEGELDEGAFEEIEDADSPTPTWKRLMQEREGPPPKAAEEKRFAITSGRAKVYAESAQRRFSSALGALDGYRHGLAEAMEKGDVEKVLAIADEKELEDWRRILAGTINTLKTVRAELSKEDR